MPGPDLGATSNTPILEIRLDPDELPVHGEEWPLLVANIGQLAQTSAS